jgi:predicted RNA-binding protein with PIN domain
MHETFIQTLQTEVTFLEEMIKAVEDRDSSGIAAATQRYTQEQQNNGKELKRVSDKLDNKVDDARDELDSLKDKVESEYNSLKSAYNL